MKAWQWLLLALGVLLVWIGYSRPPVAVTTTTAVVRDSVRLVYVHDSIRHDSVVLKYVRLPADTIGPILRALAARQPVIARDSAVLDTASTDSSCGVWLTCAESARLAIRDTSHVIVEDSLRGANAIKSAQVDSLTQHLDQCLDAQPRFGFRTGFAAGYVAGIATCVLLQ